MPTECNPELFEFAPVEGRRVVAAFDGGAITVSTAGTNLSLSGLVSGVGGGHTRVLITRDGAR